jgi:hypothetical protein
MKELQDLMNDISEWSDVVSAHGNIGGIHRGVLLSMELNRACVELHSTLGDFEVNPTQENRDIAENEYIRAFTLLLDIAAHFDMSAIELIEKTQDVLTQKKEKKWNS